MLVHILVSPGLYQFIRNIQPCSFIRNIHPCSFLETFTPTRLLDTYSPLLVYYISRKIPAYSLIRAYSFIRELRVCSKCCGNYLRAETIQGPKLYDKLFRFLKNKVETLQLIATILSTQILPFFGVLFRRPNGVNMVISDDEMNEVKASRPPAV